MAKLIYDNKEMGWRCSNCDGIFGDEEVSRAFNYDTFDKRCFTPIYCMDCGVLMDDVEMEGYGE